MHAGVSNTPNQQLMWHNMRAGKINTSRCAIFFPSLILCTIPKSLDFVHLIYNDICDVFSIDFALGKSCCFHLFQFNIPVYNLALFKQKSVVEDINNILHFFASIEGGSCFDIYEGKNRVTVFDFGRDAITGIR